MARRKNQHGAVYQRTDGRWEAQLRLPSGGRKSFYARTRREAARRLEENGWMVALGMAVTSREKTVAIFMSEWLEVSRKRVRPSTFESYELNVRRLNAFFGDVPVSRLSPPAIQDAYRRMQDGGLSSHSVLQAHRTLYRGLSQAFHWGFIPRNPAALVYPPRPMKREMTALSVDQLCRLLESARGHRLYPLYVLLGTAGLRLGEALGLKWEDVDLTLGRVMVRRTLRRQRGRGVVFGPPKTPRSCRTVLLASWAVDAVREHKCCQEDAKLRVSGWRDSGLVFTNTTGGPLEPAAPGKGLTRALRDAGLPHVRVHDLRHTTASALLAANVHPKIVQDLLGHSTIRTTLDTYSHVMPVIHAAAVTELDRLLADGAVRATARRNVSTQAG